MFRRFILWLSHLWVQLCEFTMPSTPVTQTPSTPAPGAVATTINTQTQPTFVSTSTPTCWDVFLSFRGKDTRLNFTSHLYDKLDSNGIRTFMDDPELCSGEVISDALLDAIRNSKAYIVIFSENYATSPWCLNELVEILNCHKTAQRLVIPVFYKIHPSVIRYQTASFRQAFEKHQKHFQGEREKLDNWRFTLKQVADLSGHHLSDSEDRSEANVINEIVDGLLPKINPKTLDVAKYPVGLDFHVEGITSLLSSNTKGVIKIGIHGMGGVGKTTLAKAVYNKHHRSFHGSCFLADVREASTRENGLVSLQQKLIDNVLKRKNERIDNVDQGIELIRARICSKKVLIVLDDLDNIMPLEFIVGPFAMGSIIIITTRNEDLLDSVGVEARYKVNGLGDVESRQLFMQHAFGDDKIPDTFTELSQEILEHAGGLPLAIKVFGSNLRNQPEGDWRWFINKLKRAPIEDVENKLIISFQALKSVDPMLQNIYLDIACFFVGRKKKEVVNIMETCYTFVNRHIDILNKRCLLTTNDEDELEMHDLLQDMGRNIARNESPDEPEKHSRLWASKDICDVLKKKKGTEAVECIIPRDNNQDALEGLSFTTKTFESMSKLRFLHLEEVNITGSFEQIFEDLRLLCWKYCPLRCLPSEFYPPKLVILELPDSKLRTVWEQNMVSHVFGKLKTLNMSCSRDLVATPDFNRLPSLETLNLEGCKSLEEVHISIGSLERLGSLNLEGCKKLRSLPDTICDLRALKVLNIRKCNSLEALPLQLGNIKSLSKLSADELSVSKLPVSIGDLNKLVKLDLSKNKNLESLPNTICNLRALEVLCINDCSNVKALPVKLGNLESLKKLSARSISVLKLPDSIGSLTKLVELDLSSNKKIETLPDTIGNLRSLEILSIENCEKLQALPDALWKITSLRKLDANYDELLKKVPDIGSGEIELSLQELDLSFSGIIALPSGFSQLSNLQSFNINNCKHLIYIPKLPPNLKWIGASSCQSLERLPNLSNLKHLEELDLQRCSRLTEILGLEDLTSLRKINLAGCMNLETLPDTIGNLRFLETLSIEYCEKLQALPDELWKIKSLRKLDASGARLLKKLPDIGSGQIALSLQELKLSYSGIIALPSGFSELSNLQFLHLTSCEHLVYIPKLPPNLKWIGASSCKSLERLPNLSNLKHLEVLDLQFCPSLERLPNLSNLKQLEKLELAFCSRMINIQGLEDLISIRSLGFIGLTHRHLPKRLFKVYSEFGHQIDVHVSEFIDQKTDPQWLDWITESPYWTSKSSEYPESTTVYAHLLPNESHNFMGIILCFNITRSNYNSTFAYSVRNTASGFIWWGDHIQSSHYGCGTLMVIVPKSIFSVTDYDHRIEFTTHGGNDEIVGIHLLYNTETDTIEDAVEKHVIHIDALKLIDPVLPDIFLDIACFFIGWEKKRVVQILETYYTNVDHNIDILKTRCLLKINKSDELEMDDLLLHQGRKIACNSLEEPEKHSRLYRLTDIYDALKKHKGTKVIEGIVPRNAYYWNRDDDALTRESFTLEAFKKMRKLRFLCLRKVHLTGSFEQTFQDLRWLCWDWCPLKCLPSEFYPPKLVILELRHSNIRTMWELNMVPHVFEKLKTLDMSGSEDLTTTPDFTKLPCLETVHLVGCKSLEEVHISIGNLVRLVSLDLHGCVKLRSLPNTICNLRALEVLDIHDCSCLEALPTALGNLQSLRKLNTENLTISVLPDSTGHLFRLVRLRLKSNKNLKTLPVTICNLRSLEILDISGCEKLEILPDLSKLKQLEYLNLEDCSGLAEIQGLKGLTSIRTLHLRGCNSSLLACIFTESFFQMYSEFGHPIQVYSTEFPDWISQLSECESTMSLNLPPNMSHNYLGMVLCIRSLEGLAWYSVENTTSHFLWEGCFFSSGSSGSSGDISLMAIVPRSTFSVEDGDDRIIFKADLDAKTYGIHLLYKTEEYDSTTVMKIESVKK